MTAQRAEKLAARKNKREKKKIEQKFPLFARDPAIAPKKITVQDVWREYDRIVKHFIQIEIQEVRKCFEANIFLLHARQDLGLSIPLPRLRARYRSRGELAYRVCDHCLREFVKQPGGIEWLAHLNYRYNQDAPKMEAFWRSWIQNVREQKRFHVGIFADPAECVNNGGE